MAVLIAAKIVDAIADIIISFLRNVYEIVKETTYKIATAVPGGTIKSIMNIIRIRPVVRNFGVMNFFILFPS